jgi:hypothetical protein
MIGKYYNGNFMKLKLLLLLSFSFASVLIFNGCKKNSSSSNNGNNTNNTATVFTNSTDPRLAEIKTDDGQTVTFFGLRNEDGSPKRLTGYSFTSLPDTTKLDFVTLDTLGRYSDISLGTGENLHLDYSIKDSVKIIISGPDSISNEVVAFAPNSINGLNISNSIAGSTQSNSTAGTPGEDNNIDVKVTSENSITQIETDVKGEETQVIVNLNAGVNHQYSLLATYNASKGFYSVPLSSFGLDYHDPNAIDITLSFIKNILEVACVKTKSGDPQVDKSVPKLISTVVCPIPHPYAKAICAASTAILFACKAGKILDILNKSKDVLYKIDPNAIPVTNGIVTASSRHYKYGLAYSSPVSVQQIIQNSSDYDIKVTHKYSNVASTYTASYKYDLFPVAGNWYLTLSFDGNDITGTGESDFTRSITAGPAVSTATVTGTINGSVMKLNIHWDDGLDPSQTTPDGYHYIDYMQDWIITGTTNSDHSLYNATFKLAQSQRVWANGEILSQGPDNYTGTFKY